MRDIRKIIVLGLSAFFSLTGQAQRWTTHYAYNNVTQIALGSDVVYALSDGSLFSVNKQTEQIRVYNRQSGLHGNGITCIHFDQQGNQLLICYGNGQMDILGSHGVTYLGELYDKDMTQRKTIYNVTIEGRTAYLSTAYGVQTMDLRENKFVDSYWLRPGGQEIEVKDVLLANDSIYAFTDDSLFCAAKTANLVDYTVWTREKAGRIARDTEKGIHYSDRSGQWYAGYAEGIIRQSLTHRLTYKPEGPLTNQHYRMTAAYGMLYSVPGGRWALQNFTPAYLMRFDGQSWLNISNDTIQARTGKEVLDFTTVAIDPKDRTHCFVTSYGMGLFEFRNAQLLSQTGPNEVIHSAVPADPDYYTRVDNAMYDAQGRLWLMIAHKVPYQLAAMDTAGQWTGLPLYENGSVHFIETPGGIEIDVRDPHRKWIAEARESAGLCLLDDHGTTFDTDDDQLIRRSEWTDQQNRHLRVDEIRVMRQDALGRIFLGTESGVVVIDSETDFFTSDRCIRPDVTDESGENPIESQRIMDITIDDQNQPWIGTQGMGVFVLSADLNAIVAHYTTDNTPMPSNTILSLAYDPQIQRFFIGTAEGLIEYDPNGTEEGLYGVQDDESGMEEGTMQQWKLHLSYKDATECAATPRYMYAVANGSLFSLDRADGQIEYWSKATGLNGNIVSHIAYDPRSGKLVVAYDDGRIDLIDEEQQVSQIPDLYLKAGSIDIAINSICVGSGYTYLAMPFGIVVLDTKREEVSETYYIGQNAASLDVLRVVEKGDSLYAFTADRMYAASLRDNLVDYTYWHVSSLPIDRLQNAVLHNNTFYTLQHDSLYRLNGQTWQLVLPQALSWIHASDGHLLACVDSKTLYELADDDSPVGLTNNYSIHDALYSSGEYWLCEQNWGLIRLRTTGDEVYHPYGPNSNSGYAMFTAHDQLYTVIGGRWAAEYIRYARINIFDGTDWRCYDPGQIYSRLGATALDPVSVAVDKNDPGHYFVATYGTGVFEFKDYEVVKQHTYTNSTLQPVNPTINPLYFTRTDGAMLDEQDNLWVLNATTIGQALHVMKPSGQWVGIPLVSNGAEIQLETPAGIWVDKRNKQWKWLFDQRMTPRVILLNDGGTPADSYDDRCVARSSFVDQNGNALAPAHFRCFAQDQTNRIWIGTEKGILLIPKEVDFFTSNACKRIIIPRNDGTGLGDYLLGDEQINCMAVDGGNRMWIGTANSGLYLIEDDTITVAHFTETNSLLPSNNILSIAIMPKTGEVFVGTGKGIASYRSDASEPQEDMRHAYAFPNPVRPDYGGTISITGLMDNTVVNIIDEGGNLVCKTRSHGGTAVWDGKLPDGRRATPGVYTALCNATGGHTVVKILVTY